MKNNINLKAFLALLICIFFWSSAFVCIRHFMTNSYSSGALSLARYFIASLVMLFIFIPLKNKIKPTFKDLVYFAVLGFLGFFIYNVFLNEGEKFVSAGVANFIIFQVPIVEIVLAILFLNERINKTGVFGLTICMLGAGAILAASNSEMRVLGILYVYVAAFAGAIYTAFQKKILVKFHPIEAVAYFIWFGTLFLSIFSSQAIKDFSHASLLDVSMIIYMGIFPGALSYLLWGYAFKHLKVSIAASSLYVMPLFTIFLGWVFLDEVPKALSIIGGIIAVFGAVVITRYGVKK